MPALSEAWRLLGRRGARDETAIIRGTARGAGPITAPDADEAGSASTTTRLFGSALGQAVTDAEARQFARTNPWVRTAIIKIKTRVSRAERAIVPIDPDRPYDAALQAKLTALIENPNPKLDSFRTFIEPVVQDVLEIGRGGWEYVPNWRGHPLSLYAFDAARMSLIPAWDGSQPAAPRYLWRRGPREEIGLTNDQVTLILDGATTDQPQGISRLYTLKDTIEADAAGNAYVKSLLEKYPPPGWMNLGKRATRRKVDQVATQLSTQVLGQGGFLVTGGLEDPSFQSLWAGTSRDNELMAWSIYFARKVAIVYGISPQDFGITLDVNRANGEQQAEMSREDGYLAMLLLVEEYVNREIIAKFGTPETLNLAFRFKEISILDRLRQAELVAKLAGGVPTLLYNELRAIQDQPPVALGNAAYAMTKDGPVAFIGDDAQEYRRVMAQAQAEDEDAEAQDGGTPDPDNDATDEPDGNTQAADGDEAGADQPGPADQEERALVLADFRAYLRVRALLADIGHACHDLDALTTEDLAAAQRYARQQRHLRQVARRRATRVAHAETALLATL